MSRKPTISSLSLVAGSILALGACASTEEEPERRPSHVVGATEAEAIRDARIAQGRAYDLMDRPVLETGPGGRTGGTGTGIYHDELIQDRMTRAVRGMTAPSRPRVGPDRNDRGTARTRARNDIERLVRLQDRFRDAVGRYAASVDELGLVPARGVVLAVLDADETGFSALSAIDGFTCGVAVGDAEPPRPWVEASGRVDCRD